MWEKEVLLKDSSSILVKDQKLKLYMQFLLLLAKYAVLLLLDLSRDKSFLEGMPGLCVFIFQPINPASNNKSYFVPWEKFYGKDNCPHGKNIYVPLKKKNLFPIMCKTYFTFFLTILDWSKSCVLTNFT